MAQIDLGGQTIPPAPFFDASNSYVSFHAPAGIAFNGPAGQTALGVVDTPNPPRKATANSQNTYVELNVAGIRFANPA